MPPLHLLLVSLLLPVLNAQELGMPVRTNSQRRTEAGLSVVDGTSIELPGHANDARSLPNLPFSVDSNRRSDGVSSVSPLTSTAPSFPLYKGVGLEDTDSRKINQAALEASQREQGVAGKGAGEFAQNKARLGRFVQEEGGIASIDPSAIPIDLTTKKWTGAIPSVKPEATFDVHAGVRWNPSAFAIQPGETYSITVDAAESWQDSVDQEDFPSITATTMGYDSVWDVRRKCYKDASGTCRSYFRQNRRYPPANWLHLVCSVGNFVTLLQEVAHGHDRFMPLQESELIKNLFPVDLTYTFTASPHESGELICFANDADGLYYDNTGSVSVTVRRESWPPSVDFDERYVEYLKTSLENPSNNDKYLY
jgi:hypothetical protein